MSESDIDIIRHPKFELFFRSINNFVISTEAISGGFGFYFYPHPISFNIPQETPVGKIKFVGTSFRIAEKKIIVSYRDWETLTTIRNSIALSEREEIALKRVICVSILRYMRKNKKFVWYFELASEIKSKLPYFD